MFIKHKRENIEFFSSLDHESVRFVAKNCIDRDIRYLIEMFNELFCIGATTRGKNCNVYSHGFKRIMLIRPDKIIKLVKLMRL